jgi:hypothetical protein
MRQDRLKLVVAENGATSATDGTTELPAEAAMPDSCTWRLRLVESGEEAPPDDAA